MSQTEGERWETARGEVIRRWRKILERVAARDEGGALALANVMDEFCEEASEERRTAEPHGVAIPAAGAALLPDDPVRCQFCRGFTEMGGCFGLLGEFNRAVLGRRWELARRLVENYLERLASADLSRQNERRVQ
jgi:hypothetical protein